MFHQFSGRLRRAALSAVVLSVGFVAAPTSTAATSIDQGDPAGGISCSDVATVETTCVLPIGGPLEQDGAVSTIAVGESNAELLVARPIAGSPGRFEAIRPSRSPLSWKVRQGTTVIDTAIRVKAGDQLILLDPLVTTASSSVDFDAPPDLSELATGLEVGVRALGRITVEPDADRDGYGDETSDLCPGVAGRRCVPGALVVGLNGPGYVPSQQAVAWMWTATNAGASPQPFVVNVYTGEATGSVTGPPGSTCAPGAMKTAADLFVPAAQRSPLVTMDDLPAGQAAHPHLWDGSLPDSGWSHCRLPVLQAGQSVSGTVGGTGGMGTYYGLAISGLPPIVDAESVAKSALYAKALVIHGAPGKARAAWRPTAVTPGVISNRGAMLVTAGCGGPPQAASCTATGAVTAPVGAAVLGTVRVPAVGRVGAPISAVVNFSSKGLRWLATHPKSRIDVAITTSWPGETAATTVVRVKPVLSKSLQRKLAAMVKPKKQKKAKRKR